MNIALDYDEKQLFDNSGKRVSAWNLQGMSGGPVTEHFATGNFAFFRVQGILLSRNRDKRWLIGLRYGRIVDWIAANMRYFPDPPGL